MIIKSWTDVVNPSKIILGRIIIEMLQVLSFRNWKIIEIWKWKFY